MQIPFTKMHGLGNDFVVVRAGNGPPPPAEAIRALADRKTGIGFDQLLWLEKPHIAGAAVYYRIFNTDGSEAEQCGNGARCIARLVGGEGAGALVLALRKRRAQQRAEQFASGSGVTVGALRSASQGVFQITRPNSTETADYGSYDTGTVEKVVKAVVTVEYAVARK